MIAQPQSKPLVLLPAAGFGTRVGSPPAKELLPDLQNRPLIDFALEQALAREWPVHVITRAEKHSLLEHLATWQARGLVISIQLVGPTKEWPETLLLSKPFWRENNLVVLPDTRYEPLNIWDEMLTAQQKTSAEAVYAVCESTDFSRASSWGVIAADPFRLCEKPQQALAESANSYLFWGLMMFEKSAGESLLQAHLASTFDHQWKPVAARVQLVRLQSFVDLTRS